MYIWLLARKFDSAQQNSQISIKLLGAEQAICSIDMLWLQPYKSLRSDFFSVTVWLHS